MHGGGTSSGLLQSRGALGSQTFSLTCENSTLDLLLMRSTVSCSSSLQTKRRGNGELCIEMSQSTTRVGSRLMPATHPSEILTDHKHGQHHGRPDASEAARVGVPEFVQVLTLFKLDAEVVPL